MLGRRNEEIMPSRESAPTPPSPEGGAICLHNRVGSTQEGGERGQALRPVRNLSLGGDLGWAPKASTHCLPSGTPPGLSFPTCKANVLLVHLSSG